MKYSDVLHALTLPISGSRINAFASARSDTKVSVRVVSIIVKKSLAITHAELA